LPQGQAVIFHVEATENGDAQPPQTGNAWDVLDALAGTVNAPTDWALEHDHYLYGTPKRSGGNPK
jgi:hypothetical protein